MLRITSIDAIRILAYYRPIEALTQRDFRAILQFLEKLYQPTGLERFRQNFGAYLRELIPSDLGAYSEMNPDKGTSIHVGNPAGIFTPEFTREHWLPVMREHPVLMHAKKTGDQRSYRVSDFYSQARFHSLALYHEFYRPLSVQDVLCKAITVAGSVVIGASLHRGRRSFSERDRLIFDLIGPHLTQAWRNAQAFSQVKQRAEAQSCALEALDCELIGLTPTGRVRWMTPRALALLEEFFGTYPAANRHLPDALARWVRHANSQLAPGRVPAPPAPLILTSACARLIARLLKSPAQDLLLLRVERNPARLAALEPLGITRREAEVLCWTAEGKTNGEIAAILGASTRTVQKHLEHIYQKLGVETRTAASARFRELTSPRYPA